MFFLLRMAFWLALVLALLGRERLNPREPPQACVPDAVHAQRPAVSDLRRFCKRAPAPSKVGGEAAAPPTPARQGARKIDQPIAEQKPGTKPGTDRKAPDRTGSITSQAFGPAPVQVPSRDTLTLDDLAVERRGPP